jgi:hypothetical protein
VGREVWVIEDVEKLRSETKTDLLREMNCPLWRHIRAVPKPRSTFTTGGPLRFDANRAAMSPSSLNSQFSLP